ncbi:MAG: hypothetical protein ACREO8_07325, partial [Luteimonas sp.]
LTSMLLHHPHRTFTYFWGKLVRLVHGFIFSRVEASSNPGAVQQHCHVVTLMDVLAHPKSLRRKRRGIEPGRE